MPSDMVVVLATFEQMLAVVAAPADPAVVGVGVVVDMPGMPAMEPELVPADGSVVVDDPLSPEDAAEVGLVTAELFEGAATQSNAKPTTAAVRKDPIPTHPTRSAWPVAAQRCENRPRGVPLSPSSSLIEPSVGQTYHRLTRKL
jgi:hypothetical protein